MLKSGIPIEWIQKLSRKCIRISSFHLHAVAKKNHNNEIKTNQTNPKQPSINLTEVEHHEKFASDWWSPKGPVYALHSMNMIRVPFIRDGLIATDKVKTEFHDTEHILKDLQILEVGCGGGILTEQLGRLHANVIGIDLGDKLIEIAKTHLKNQSSELIDRVEYKLESIEEHSRNNTCKYDAVVVSEVLEHIDDKGKFLSACVDALKPGGSIFITTLNRTFPSLIGAIMFAEYVLRIVPRGTHNWNKFISPIETQRILDSLNCSVVLINGFTFEVWKNTWRWIPSTSLSYAMQAIKQE